MSYRVIVSSKARIELYNDAIWWAENRDAHQAARWLDGFQSAIESLADNPDKYGFAIENDAIPNHELRQMPYGLSRKATHRAVFEIRGDTVYVYGIRHVAQQDLTPEDLE